MTIDHEAFTAAGEDYAGRLPGGVAAIAAQLAELEALRVPAVAASRALPAFYACVALLLSAAAGIELGPMVGGTVFAGTVAIWLITAFWLRSTTRFLIGEFYPPLVQGVAEVNWLLDRALAVAKAHTKKQQSKLIEKRDQASAPPRNGIRPSSTGCTKNAKRSWPARPRPIPGNRPRSRPPAIGSCNNRKTISPAATAKPGGARRPNRSRPPSATIARSN